MALRTEPITFPGMPRTVLVTGISGNLGRALAKLLHTETRVVGLDRRPFPGKPKDIAHHQLDIRKARVEDVFRRHRPEALIHLGIMHDPRDAPERGPLVQRPRHAQDPRPLRPARREEGGRALLGERLRPAPRQLELPARGDAAHGGRAVQRDARPRRARHVRAVVHVEAPRDRDGDPAPGEHRRPDGAERALELPAARAAAHGHGVRPDGPAHPRGGRLPRARARAQAGPARRLQRDGPGAGAALRRPARARTPPHPRAAPPRPLRSCAARSRRGSRASRRRRSTTSSTSASWTGPGSSARRAGAPQASLRETIRSVA